MAFPSIRINIGADLSKLKKDLNKGEGFVHSFGKAATRAFDGAVLAAGAFVTKIAIDGVKAASDLNETVSKTNVIFGDSAKKLQEWAEANATAMGQTRQQALDAAATFAIFGKQAGYTGDKLVGFSTDFTVLASDLASFNNTSPDEAITALGAALRGESEPIRKYGVLLSDAAIQAKAYSDQEIASNKKYFSMQGKKEVLNDQGKLLARYKLILEQTTDAQGDFARTSDGLANGQRVLNATWDDAQAKIGEALLPAIQDLVKWANSPDGKKFIDDFAVGMADAFKSVAENAPKIFAQLEKFGGVAKGMGISWKDVFDPKFLFAAGAFRAALPFGIGAAAIAGILAYSMAGEALKTEEQKKLVGIGAEANFMKVGGFYDDGGAAYVSGYGFRISNKAEHEKRQARLRDQEARARVSVIVNGAVDPVGTAVAINRALGRAAKSGTLNLNVTAPSF